jgi:hypothetical protein
MEVEAQGLVRRGHVGSMGRTKAAFWQGPPRRLRFALLFLVGAGLFGAGLVGLLPYVRTGACELGDEGRGNGPSYKTSLYAAGPRSLSRRVAIVLPYAEEAEEGDALLSVVEGWAGGDGITPACSSSSSSSRGQRQGRASVGLFFYGAGDAGREGPDLSKRLRASLAAKKLTSCLSEVGTLLSASEANPIDGAASEEEQEQWRQRRLSHLFYRLLLDEEGHVSDALADYTHVLWLDWRATRPLRPHWVDAIAEAAATRDRFWMRGSQYQGPGLDDVALAAAEAGTAATVAEGFRRLSGNALYALRDPDFATFLRIVRERRVSGYSHVCA